MRLSPLIAGAVSAAILAGLSVWIFTQLPGLWVWAAFIGWASFDHSGADRKALVTSATCMVFGVAMAWLVALVVATNVLPLPVSAASAVAAALASFVIVWVSRFVPFSNVPATFGGFASAFAFLLMSPGAFSTGAMTSLTLGNVLICTPISLLIGSTLGVVHKSVAKALTSSGHQSGVTPAAELPR